MSVNDGMLLNLIQSINNELTSTKYVNLSNIIYRVYIDCSKDSSISDDEIVKVICNEVNKILINNNSVYCAIIKNNEYSNLFLQFNYYIREVAKYYIKIMSLDSTKFDRYVEISNGNYPSDKIIKSEDLYMSIEQVQNTMELLNEAVRNYYDLYYKKRLITVFSDEEVIEFKIKESELAHILGVQLKKIVNEPKYVDLFHITQSEIDAINDYTLDPLGNAALEVLTKIVDISNGNLLQSEEDRLKKIKGHSYGIMHADEEKMLKNYSKINMKSKSFLDFKPLETLSMAFNLPKNFKLIRQSKVLKTNYSLIVSKNQLSNIYKYSSIIANYDEENNRRYFQSMFVSKPEQMKNYASISVPSISMEVALEGDDGSLFGYRNFTNEEQLNFLKEVQNDLDDINIQELIDYFSNIKTKKRRF